MDIDHIRARLGSRFAGTLVEGEPLSRHTTYRIGGPALLMATCRTLSSLEALLDVLDEEGVPWTVLGRGSDLLVSDEGYAGCVIVLEGELAGFEFPSGLEGEEDLTVRAGAGVSLPSLARACAHEGMSGLEFAAGIPGTLGGALFMNAGAHDCSLADIVANIAYYVPRKGLSTLSGDSVDWGYRRGVRIDGAVIVGATLRMQRADEKTIEERMRSYLERRKKTQPLEYPSCGSVFRNPEGDHAARLISACGLKGTAHGGARISDKHANFIVNEGGARAQDVLWLIELVQRRVKERYAIELRPELEFLGFPSH